MRPNNSVPILDSPYLTLPVIETLLQTVTDPRERVKLLSARVHCLVKALPGRFTGEGKGGSGNAVTSGTSLGSTTSKGESETSLAGQELSSRHPVSTLALQPAYPTSSSASLSQNRPRPTRRERPDPTPLLRARQALALAYLSVSPPELHAAEAECLAVEGECKRLSKAAKRWEREAQDEGVSDVRQENTPVVAAIATTPEEGTPRGLLEPGPGQAKEIDQPVSFDTPSHEPVLLDTPVHKSAPNHLAETTETTGATIDQLPTPSPAVSSDTPNLTTLQQPSSPKDGAVPDWTDWIQAVRRIRLDTLRILVRIEEGLGRPARAERWRKVRLDAEEAGIV